MSEYRPGGAGEPRELRELLSWIDVGYEGTPIFDQLMASLAEMGLVIVPRERFERLRAYVVADQEFSQASTWAGVISDDAVVRAAVQLQYAARDQRRRDARRAIRLGDLEPVDAAMAREGE